MSVGIGMKKTVLAVFHDNNLTSGATKSFLSNLEYMDIQGDKIIAFIPEKPGDLSEYLMEKGIKVAKYSYGGNVYSKGNSKLDTLKHYLRCYFKSIISWCSAHKAAKALKNEKINCIYSNTSTIYFGAWIANILHIPHFWHFREFCLEDQNSIRIWQKQFIKLARQSQTIFTISHVIDDYYKQNYGFDNTQMVYNDISKSYINEVKTPHEGTNILITGTICKEKGQEIAIKAVTELSIPNMHLFIAGKKNEYAENLIKNLCKNNQDKITFCGLVKDMSLLRSNIDLSLVCSKKEAFGRTIIEDMLAGIVVIGCDTGAVTELITNQETGYVYEYGNVEDLKQKIIYAIDNTDKTRGIKSKAFVFAQGFTQNRTAKYVRDIIDGID